MRDGSEVDSVTVRALLIEDNHDLAQSVGAYLTLDSIECDYATSGAQGLDLARSRPYEVILLDINLPRLNGLQVCEALRREGINVPVLMLTARDTLEDKLAGFEAGTDDYLVKPFEMRELIVRVRALAQRRSGRVQRLQVDGLELDLTHRTASREGLPLALTPTGWRLLELLMREAPSVVSRERMEAVLWGDGDAPDSNALKVHLHRLRQQVDKPFKKPMLHTVARHGVALRLDDD